MHSLQTAGKACQPHARDGVKLGGQELESPMSTFPNSLDAMNPLASVIVLQYNPEKLTRTFQAKDVRADVEIVRKPCG